MNVNNLFPTPLVEDELKPSKAILSAIKTEEFNETIYNSLGKTYISENKFFLDNFSPYKREICRKFSLFIKDCFANDDTKFDIGTSWITKISPGGMSQPHTHPNYFFSGVWYLSDDCSPLLLDAPVQPQYSFTMFKPTWYNIPHYAYKPQQGSLIFFPSYIRHMVTKNNTDCDRYSIAFNIKPVGEYGANDGWVK